MGPQGPSLLLEQFGPLQGVRVLSTGSIVAEPVAAGMAAEMGAEVIHIERPCGGEAWRQPANTTPTGHEDVSHATQPRRVRSGRTVSCCHAYPGCSKMVAIPWPTPTHMVAKPRCTPRRFISWRSVVVIRAPLHPSG